MSASDPASQAARWPAHRPHQPGPALAVEPLYMMERAGAYASALLRHRLRRMGYSLPSWRALAALDGAAPQTVTALAAHCLMQQPTMTKLLDRLVRNGLVARSHDARDRRVVRVQLTDKGAAAARLLQPAVEAARAEALKDNPVLAHPSVMEALAAIRAPSTP